MGDSSELINVGAAELVRQMRAGLATPSGVLSACLDRIADREPVVEAWQHLDAEGARQKSRALDVVPFTGALHGVPIGIKDIIDTADMPTGLGSTIFQNRYPNEDADAVQLLRAAGAVVVGKTVSTEFAYFTPGKTHNPHDPSRTPGGSSSGSAAAVADRMVPIALATQAAGSTIRPASFCGVWAYKTSFGRWPIRGSLQLYPNLDTLSIYARHVEDLILVDSVLATAGQKALQQIPDSPRIGVFTPPAAHWALADETTRRALDAAAAHLAHAGAKIVHARVPDQYEQALAASETILGYEVVRGMRFVPAAEHAHLSQVMRDVLRGGENISDEQYRAALQLGEVARHAADEMLDQFDFVLAPGAIGEAPVGLGSTGNPIFIRVWNFLHAPSANVPLFRGPAGMPVGIQIICRRGADERLLAGLRWIEQTFTTPLQL